MNPQESRLPLDSRALEFALAAAAILLAADMIRTELRPFWQTLRLLFGI